MTDEQLDSRPEDPDGPSGTLTKPEARYVRDTVAKHHEKAHPEVVEAREELESDLVERTDATFRGTGMKGYVNRLYKALAARDEDIPEQAKTDYTAQPCPPEFEKLVRFIIAHWEAFPRHYRFDTYEAAIRENATTFEADDLVKSLILMDADWRAELVAHDASVKTLGIARDSRSNTLSWRDPQPDMFCGFVARNGARCREIVVPGSPRCVRHGGMLLDPEARRGFLLSAYASIVEAADDAVTALVHVATHGRNELARVAAAKEILDRAGLTPTLNVNLQVSSGGEQITALQEKLDSIQKNLRSRAIDVGSSVHEEPAEEAAVDPDGA